MYVDPKKTLRELSRNLTPTVIEFYVIPTKTVAGLLNLIRIEHSINYLILI